MARPSTPHVLALGALALALLALPACSIAVGQRSACERSSQCRASFGVGHVCGEDGLCRPVAPHRRCRSADPPDLLEAPERHRSTVVIGTIFGSIPSEQIDLHAAELAVRQARRAGGLPDHPLALLHCDSTPFAGDELDDVEAAAEVAHYLADFGAPVILGATTSSGTVAAYEALRGRDVVLISPSATSAELSELDGVSHDDERPGLLWRTVASDDLQGRVIAEDMRRRGVQRLTILHEPGPYGGALARVVASELAGAAMVDVLTFDASTLATRVVEIAERDDDELLLVSSIIGDLIGFLNAASVSPRLLERYSSRGIFLTDAAAQMELIDEVMPAARAFFPQIRGTRPAVASDTPLQEELYGAFAIEFREDPTSSSFTAHSYDAGALALYGLAWASLQEAEISGTTIARGLRRTSEGEQLAVRAASWPLLLEAFRAGESIDLSGASGGLDFDPVSEELLTPIEVWTVEPDGPAGWAITTEYVVDPAE